jgi:hypothetical protein
VAKGVRLRAFSTTPQPDAARKKSRDMFSSFTVEQVQRILAFAGLSARVAN